MAVVRQEPIELTEPIGSSWEMVEPEDDISNEWMTMDFGEIPFRFTYINEVFTRTLVGNNIVVHVDDLGFVRFTTEFSCTIEK